MDNRNELIAEEKGMQTIGNIKSLITQHMSEYAREFPDYFYEDISVDEAISKCADNNVDTSWVLLNKWMANEDHIIVFEDCIDEGLIDTNDFDFHRAMQMAQYEAITRDLEENITGALHLAVLEHVKDLGIYAYNRGIVEDEDKLYKGIDFDDTMLTRNELNNQVDTNLTCIINARLPQEQNITPEQLRDYISHNPINEVTLTIDGVRQLIDNPHLTTAQQAPSARKGMSR